jgi:hypothetical protein
MQWMMAAILICGSNVLTSCVDGNDDNPVIDNLAEKLIGKWMIADIDGEPALTNEKEVITFVSPTKAYISRSRTQSQEMDSDSVRHKPQRPDSIPGEKRGSHSWKNYDEYDVTIEGNTVTLSASGESEFKRSTKYQIKFITASDFECEVTREAPKNGKVPPADREKDGDKKKRGKHQQRYERVTVDFKQEILGKWEGHITSEMGSEFDDGEDHQWEYLADDTFRYYFMDLDGSWFVNPDQTDSDYFVDGYLLCTRWTINSEVEEGEKKNVNREWWEIESIEDGVMKWKALRAREDGTTYIATFTMNKVKEE